MSHAGMTPQEEKTVVAFALARLARGAVRDDRADVVEANRELRAPDDDASPVRLEYSDEEYDRGGLFAGADRTHDRLLE